MDKVPNERNAKDTIQHMWKAAYLKKPIFGVKCPSQLINLLHFDIIYGCVTESMHCLFGVAKQFGTTWFGNKKKSGLLSKAFIPEIDAQLSNIKAPHQIVRLT